MIPLEELLLNSCQTIDDGATTDFKCLFKGHNVARRNWESNYWPLGFYQLRY